MATTHGTFVWYELLTGDSHAAEKFYSDVVGWQISDAGMPNMDYRICTAGQEAIAGIMQLTDEMQSAGTRPCWLGYISVGDVEGALAGIVDAGARVMVPPTDIPEVGRWAMIADPQGVAVYVIALQNDSSRAFDSAADGHCAWNELATPDQRGAQAFYSSQFGWQLGETMNMGDMGDYLIFKRDEQDIGGIMTAGASPPMWRFYFRVASLPAAIERLQRGGGTLVHGPQPVPGNDEIAIGVDPQGAMFALVGLRE